MTSKKLLFCVILFLALPLFVCAQEKVRNGMTAAGSTGVCPERGTWSEKSASRWEDALVSGNGRMGLMLFGDPLKETIVINHCRLFLPLGSSEILPDLAPSLPELRDICRTKGYREGMDFILGKAKAQGFPGIINTDPFHPGLFVHIEQAAVGMIRDYSRTENFATGEVAVRWTDDRGEWTRRAFISRADNLAAISLEGSEPLSCTLIFPPLNPSASKGSGGWVPGVTADQIESHQQVEREWVSYHNIYSKGKGGFDAIIRIHVEGGKARISENNLVIENANNVVLLIRISPWKTPLPESRSEAWAYSPDNPDFAEGNLARYVACPELADSSVVAYLDTESAKSLLPELRDALEKVAPDYETLLESHEAIHRPLFERAGIDLGTAADERQMSSEQLLGLAEKEGRLPLALAEKMYDAGRYMFLCSAGELPPNLQGIWTGTWKPAWSGDFTLDTNLQLAIKHGFSGNYPELMEGYFRLMEAFYPEWRLNARRCYGADGFLTNPRASNTALLLHWGRWPGLFWTAGCSWLARPFYQHYLYTGDREFLSRRTVPLLEEVAAFYEDFIVLDEAGRIEFIPSYSPETGSCTSATMDVMAMRDAISNLISAYRILNIKIVEIRKWEELTARLPEYRITEDGALSEWIGEKKPEKYGHRHLSHLHSAYEANGELGPDADPKLRAAAQEAVRLKIITKGEQSSHGRAHKALAAAELDLSEAAYSRIEIMATRRSMVPSLMCTHEPGGRIFNVDANGAIPEIMHRMLFRSRPGSMDLLPALPSSWPSGEIMGVLAKGQISIDWLAWDRPAGRIDLRLTSRIMQTITLRLALDERITAIKVIEGKATLKKIAGKADRQELTLPANETVQIGIRFE